MSDPQDKETIRIEGQLLELINSHQVTDNPKRELMLTPDVVDLIRQAFETAANEAEKLPEGQSAQTVLTSTSNFRDAIRYGVHITITIGKVEDDTHETMQ